MSWISEISHIGDLGRAAGLEPRVSWQSPEMLIAARSAGLAGAYSSQSFDWLFAFFHSTSAELCTSGFRVFKATISRNIAVSFSEGRGLTLVLEGRRTAFFHSKGAAVAL
jgi:hypothetical protein